MMGRTSFRVGMGLLAVGLVMAVAQLGLWWLAGGPAFSGLSLGSLVLLAVGYLLTEGDWL